jgi:leucyl/phenylalanyl-tRNA--protein transferase
MDDFDFPDLSNAPEDQDLIAVGQFDTTGEPISLTPGGLWPKLIVDGSKWDAQVILAAYRRGLFPMPLDAIESPNVISWWSPNPRGVLRPTKLRVTRSLKQSIKKYRVTVNQNFEEVIRNCASPERPSGWITQDVIEAYLALHELGYAHSVEVWDKSGALVGGLYGLELGGLFAGESMFYKSPDASKVALVQLAKIMDDGSGRLIDCQWNTEHLASLGVQEISRLDYLSGLPKLLKMEPKFKAITQM